MNHLLPDGTTTDKTRKYIDAWREFTGKIERVMPGWTVYAFEPGVSLSNAAGRNVHLDIEVARTLVKFHDLQRSVQEYIEDESQGTFNVMMKAAGYGR